MLDADCVLNVVFTMIIWVQSPVGLYAKLSARSGADLVVQGIARRAAAIRSPTASLSRHEHGVEVVQIGGGQRCVVLSHAGLNRRLVVAKQIVDHTEPRRPVLKTRHSFYGVTGNRGEVASRNEPACGSALRIDLIR